MRRLVQVLDVELAPAKPHASLVDARRLEAADPSAFAVLVKYMQPREKDFSTSVLKQALLRPEGVVGAVVGGFYTLLSGAYPSRAFSDPAQALEWLGQPDTVAGPLLSKLNDLVAEATGQSPLLRELHQVMKGKLPEVNLSDVAREMGMSERTLQRRLKEAGTSFQAELNAVQVRMAQSLLMETDMKLTAVAVEVGCASLQHFSSLFRKMMGESPSAWRDRQLGKTPLEPEAGENGHARAEEEDAAVPARAAASRVEASSQDGAAAAAVTDTDTPR
ncbi:helix-turn-helix transcriptional regulator [Pyxidicoccus fallax]|uniref:Helix-turn-helix transcriptional regulator n=1 Tax=Pyxidicoccus fallax TaxID=394095 RepID=A0A848LBH7_9BACT|nr:helix-turn-helix transcriptional regulator [Pyxidicoccus fallax]NPC85229.1 helix-turn-helix transcriptional regulator [Pyxidicoccus fallax]